MACSRCAKRKAKLKAAVAKAVEVLGLKPAAAKAQEWPPAWLEWR